MKRVLRVVALLLVGVIVLGGVATMALHVALTRGALAQRIDAALERAIGREVTQGAFSIRLGLRPRIGMADATIANIPGGSRPDFARIGQLDVTLALLPLFSGRVEIDTVSIADAEIVLERNAEGRANWEFGEGGGADSGGGGISIAAIGIESSRILLPGQPVGEIGIASLDLSRDEPGDPLVLDGRITVDGEALAVSATLGVETAGAAPIAATLNGTGLRISLSGSWPRGVGAPAWSLAVEAEADAAAVQRLARLAGRTVPQVGAVRLAARVSPGEPVPTVSSLTLSVGATDLGAHVAGLALSRLELTAASFDAPVAVTARGRRGRADLGLTATLPSLRRIATEETLPIEAVLTAGAARLVLSGPIPRDLDLGPAVFDARLTTPDAALVGPVLGIALPRVTGVTAHARLGGLTTRELRLNALSVTADALEMDGDLTIVLAPRTAFRGQLAARRIDLDALGGGGPAPRRNAARVLPDLDLPIGALQGVDAALRLSARQLTAGGVTWRDASGTVALANGRLVIDPVQVTTPGGPVGGRAVLDGSVQPPRAELRLDSRGRGLDLAALRRAFGVPAGFDGSAEVAFDLRGSGATTRAVLATLSGEAGIAMVGGRFSGGTALRIGPDLLRALMPRGTPAGGVALRCLALRLSAADGVAHSEALLMEGDFGRIDGTLAINMRDEAIAARLLPDVTVMGVTVRAPVTIGGTLADPRIGVEPAAALARVIGDTVANRLWRSSTVEFLRGATGSTPPGGDCGGALTLARLGRVGPMPAAAPTPIPLVPREIQGTARDVMQGIGGLLGGRRR
ncbi:AsmA family protein [Roseomonas terrae]|jgi:uncharacterized protein involved in outer membrane biogenesis|uniref:AsmA family protein n=1 Tax=Neoroseomonas terrae TaxID=424799 RepID=A0ABS5EGU7_9PROT|nr:AsmA family protein [Neoroseomonas terrae]MBR0650253.1 AsmA family protein [Neoroseomonas terrae]